MWHHEYLLNSSAGTKERVRNNSFHPFTDSLTDSVKLTKSVTNFMLQLVALSIYMEMVNKLITRTSYVANARLGLANRNPTRMNRILKSATATGKHNRSCIVCYFLFLLSIFSISWHFTLSRETWSPTRILTSYQYQMNWRKLRRSDHALHLNIKLLNQFHIVRIFQIQQDALFHSTNFDRQVEVSGRADNVNFINVYMSSCA